VTTDAVALRLWGWSLPREIPWKRALGSVVVLFVCALVVQPPVSNSPGGPAKADPALYAQAAAHPSQTFPVIVRETVPSSSAAEDLVRGLGGHVARELSIIGGFSATGPRAAVARLTPASVVWRGLGGGRVHLTTRPHTH